MRAVFFYLGGERPRAHARWGVAEGESEASADSALTVEPDVGIELRSLRS